jgi:signal peptidase I
MRCLYDLTIALQAVNITGKPAEGMTINGGSMGPTLRFRQWISNR